MAFLDRREIYKRFAVTLQDKLKWLRNHNRPVTQANLNFATKKIRASRIKRAPGKEVTIRSPKEPWQVIYGETRVGGVVTFLEVSSNKQNIHLVVTIAAHEIESVEKLYLDGEEVIFGDPMGDPGWSTALYSAARGETRPAVHKVFMDVNHGEVGQAALASLITNLPGKWNSACKQSGRAHVYIILKNDVTLFPDELPEITFLVRGKKVYDPRTDSTAWSKNAALCIADFLTEPEWGAGFESDELEMADGESGSLWNAADICDEAIGTIFEVDEARYEINGSFKVDAEVGRWRETLARLETAIAGKLNFNGGIWRFYPGAWTGPVIDLDEGSFLGPIEIETLVSRDSNFNAVRGTYISPLNDYEQTDFPAYKNSFYLEQDNGQLIFEDIDLPFTQSSSAAQRISKIFLEEQRQQIQIRVPCMLHALKVLPRENITITYARFGWTAKPFRVLSVEDLMSDDGESGVGLTILLTLRETAEGVYDWNGGDETRVDLAPNTNLPGAFDIEAPSPLTLTSGTSELDVRIDGSVFSRLKVSWPSLADTYVSNGGRIEIQYKKTADSDWINAPSVPGESTFTRILDVADGESYTVRARSVSAFGTPSDWTESSAHVVIGKTEAPSQVTDFSGQITKFGIDFSWSKGDPDVYLYEIRQGQDGDSWDDASELAKTDGTKISVDLQITGNYRFFIKAIDSSGNYSTDAAMLSLNVNGPEAPSVSHQIAGENLILNWTKPNSVFDLAEYEVRYGADYNSAISLGTVKATSLRVRVDWSGARIFWVTGFDVATNEGESTQHEVTILSPGPVLSLTAKNIDNNILLKFSAPSVGTLPIQFYRVYKGDEFATAELIGQVSATFKTFFEQLGGSFSYWVVPVDTAENVGPEASVGITVGQPPDYVLYDDQIIDPSTGTGINFDVADGLLVLPVNSSESWEEHFINNGFTNIEDQILAGFPKYIQPGPSVALWSKTIDYGAVIDGANVTLQDVLTEYGGSVGLVRKVAYSLDNVTFTEVEGNQIYATNFRYVRVKYQVGTLGGAGSAMGVLGLTYSG